jgi:hypothetical protein
MEIQDNIKAIEIQTEQLITLYNQLIASEMPLKDIWLGSSLTREKEIFTEIRRLSELKSKLIICTLPANQQELFKPPDIVYVDRPVEIIKTKVVTRHTYWAYFFVFLLAAALAGESILYLLGYLKLNLVIPNFIDVVFPLDRKIPWVPFFNIK